ncbi:hypothetical protein ASPSYDRAFT_90837 [Aspergillus sydowii CBS 593.65]|uniref:Uncharacterized protein n=1 Tax=Aspergillus sydowii CBS 593.65 TaxID=1036612 RepID=A0A1L9TDP7_9EURO|nr:uncharacterized protein ASPSYDRAFT_90837 [Aspergillus sydowii CBS 593.65]OJJ57554.1 hypothetical protein ASPSYDRAFT_90837 [Aspergillus sydowii CBS 593.65]
MTSGITTSPDAAGAPDSASPSRQPATNPTQSSSSPSTTTQPQSNPQPAYPDLGPNFAHNPKAPFTVSYDQEVYLQLMAGEEDAAQTGVAPGSSGSGSGSGTGPDAGNRTAGTKKNTLKTPTQIYREEWVRRALNPAISDPRGEPSSTDFECAETQRARDRF